MCKDPAPTTKREMRASLGLFTNKIFVVKLINDCLSNEKLLKVFSSVIVRLLPPHKPIYGVKKKFEI